PTRVRPSLTHLPTRCSSDLSVNSMMSGINQPIQSNVTPPPITNSTYYVAINGQATGPFNVATLKQMLNQGQFSSESLVWKEGMTDRKSTRLNSSHVSISYAA